MRLSRRIVPHRQGQRDREPDASLGFLLDHGMTGCRKALASFVISRNDDRGAVARAPPSRRSRRRASSSSPRSGRSTARATRTTTSARRLFLELLGRVEENAREFGNPAVIATEAELRAFAYDFWHRAWRPKPVKRNEPIAIALRPLVAYWRDQVVREDALRHDLVRDQGASNARKMKDALLKPNLSDNFRFVSTQDGFSFSEQLGAVSTFDWCFRFRRSGNENRKPLRRLALRCAVPPRRVSTSHCVRVRRCDSRSVNKSRAGKSRGQMYLPLQLSARIACYCAVRAPPDCLDGSIEFFRPCAAVVAAARS